MAKQTQIGDYKARRCIKKGKPALAVSITLPLDTKGAKASRSFTWSAALSDDQIRRMVAATVEKEWEVVRTVLGSPHDDVGVIRTAMGKGLFQTLVEQALVLEGKRSRKNAGKALSEIHISGQQAGLRHLIAFWLDVRKGWHSTKAKKMKPTLMRSYLLPKGAEEKLTAMLDLLKGMDPAPRDFHVGHANEFVEWLLACDLHPQTVNNVLAQVHNRFNGLYKTFVGNTRLIDVNPFSAKDVERVGLPAEREKIIYTADEEARLFETLHGSKRLSALDGWEGQSVPEKTQRELAIFCEIAIRTGLRRVSIFNDLDLSQYDQEARRLRVAPRKGGRVILLPVDDDLHHVLQLFRLMGGKWTMTTDYISHLMGWLVRALGIQIMSPIHGFRATMFSRVREIAGETMAKDLVGHAIVGVAKHYSQETEARSFLLAEVLRKIKLHPLPLAA